MTLTYSIPTTQSWASGDCINVDLVSNPYVSSSTSYSPFTDLTGCTISSGPTLQNCRIPTSATSVGQSFQVIASSTSSGKSIIATFKSNNPFSQRSLIFRVSYLKACAGSQINAQTITLSFKPGTISSMTLATNTDIVGDTNGVLTVKFQVGTSLRTMGRIELEVPILYDPLDGTIIPCIDSTITSPQVTSASDTASSTRAITVTSRSFDNNAQKLTIEFTTTSTMASGQWMQFSVSNFNNPINYNSLTGFKISTYEVQSGGSSALIDQSTTSFALVKSSLKPQSLKNGLVDIYLTGTETSSYTIGQKDRDLLIYFEVSIPLQATCYLRVTFPEEIKLNVDDTLTTVTGDGFMLGSNILRSTLSYASGNQVILNGCPSVSQGYTQSTNLVFQQIVSPAQVKEVTGFKVELAIDLAFTQILASGTNQQGFSISKNKFTAESITLASFAPSSTGTTTIQELTSYTASFTLTTSLYQSSIIEVTMPQYVTSVVASPTCTISGLNAASSVTCTRSTAGNSVLIANPFTENSSPTAGWDFKTTTSSSITVTINGAYNPVSEKNAGLWKVTTYNVVSGVSYIVDTGTMASSFTPVKGKIAKQADITVVPATTSSDQSTYTFFITVDHSIPISGQILITLPSDLTISSTALLRSSCLYYSPTTGTPIQQSCAIQGTTTTIVIMTMNVVHDKANTLKLELKGFMNPRTFKQTGSFLFQTRDKDGNNIDDTVTANFYVKMTILASVTGMSVTAKNLTNGDITPYLVSFVSTIALKNGDKIELTFDSNIKPKPLGTALTGPVTCIGVTQFSALSCGYTGNKLTVTITSTLSATGTYAFNITQVTNPPSTRPYKVITDAIFSDSTGNQLMSLPSTIFVMLQTQLPGNIQTYSLTQSRLDHSQKAVYKLTFKTTNPISGLGSMTITWPSQVVKATGTTVKCTVTTQSSYTDKCNFNDLTRTIIIKDVFNPSSTVPYSGTVVIELDSLTNPADNRVVNGFTISTFDDALQTFKIDKLDDNILVPQSPCIFPCKSCSDTDRLYCSSCWTDVGSPFLMKNSTNSTCKQGCDTGYTTNGNVDKICEKCDVSCTTCADNYVKGDKSKCVTCGIGYSYTFSARQQCMKNCTSKGYYESSPYVCNLCASNCERCERSASNCTSCDASKPQYRYLFDFQCLENCPNGYVNVGQVCQKCDPKCGTCANSTTQCMSCDSSSKYKYTFGYQCLETCPEGTNPDKQKLQCFGCLKGCKQCDSRNQTKCLECESPLLEYNGDCVKECPAGTSASFFGNSCTEKFTFNFPSIPYPHLCACGAMTLICLLSILKDRRRALFITNMIVLWGPVEFVSYLSLTGISYLYSTYKFAGASGMAFGSYLIMNIAAAIAFEVRIARKDVEYIQWRKMYPKTSRLIIIFAGIFSFKILRLHYSLLFGYDCFKASFQYPGVFQRQIIIFTILHFFFSNCIILGVDIVGLTSMEWNTQLATTMLETGGLTIIVMILDFIELCKIKKYLGDDERIDYDKLLNQMNESMDKKLRQDMLKQIMNHVRGNKDLRLNNRFDELLSEMGPRRCNSMIEFGNELEEDPRKVQTCPNSPKTLGDGYNFDPLPTIDNVYAESKPADPLGNLGKTFSDFDSQVLPKDFDKFLSRKGGDFVTFDSNDNNYKRNNKKSKARGRKNQYYTQIDAEDDEEADHLGTYGDAQQQEQEDLDIIKEEDDQEEIKRVKKEQKRLQTLKEQQEKEESEKKQRELEEQERLRVLKVKEEEEKKRLEMQENQRIEREKLERQKRDQQERLRAEQEQIRLIEQEKYNKEQIRLEQERIKAEQEQIRIQQEQNAKLKKEAEDLEKRKQMELEMQKLEEERLKRENDEKERKLKEEQEAKRLEEEIALQTRRQREQAEIEEQQQKKLQQEKVLQRTPSMRDLDFSSDPIVQIPPDFQKRNFNENDILGDFDRDEKGNVIVLQDGNEHNIDKQGRAVNERGYLQDPATGDIIENYNNKKMFAKQDIDERGEIPGPFCVEKYNFNPFLVKGEVDYDKSGRPIFGKDKNGKLVDKLGRVVNNKGWLLDPEGNICDQNGRKKFDHKQMTPEGDFPRLFNLNGRRFDVNEVCGQLNRNKEGNLIFKKNKKGMNVDNIGRLVNERGYLIDENGNIIDKERKKIFESKFLKHGEFPKIFPFTKFNIKRVQGNFEMDPIGNPILDRGPNGQFLDRDGNLVNQRGYLIDPEGNVIDKNGQRMFEKEILDLEGEIPKVFRTGLLKSDTASSLSRLMSEIERNQPSEYGNPQWRRVQQKEELKKANMERQEKERNEAHEKLSGNTSVDSMMEDTPSNYNIANQRFDQTHDMLNAKSQQLQMQNSHYQQMPVDEVQEEEESQFDGDYAAGDDSILKKRRMKKKKKVVQVYADPSDKDIMMAKAYGGVARGPPKRVIPKNVLRDTQTPLSQNQRGSRLQMAKVAGTVTGYNRDSNSRGENRNNMSSIQNLEEMKIDNHTGSMPGILDESQEASFIAVPEHHIREQRLKQRQMNDLKSKGKVKRNNKGAGDPDFEKMFGKDIDEFLEDSDWDIESFDNMSQYSKGTSRSMLHDGRIRGLESIYLQRIETSMKRGGLQTRKHQKQPAGLPKFRPMQDRLVTDPSQIVVGEHDRISGVFDGPGSMSQSRIHRPQFVESANTTGIPQNRIPQDQNNGFSRQAPKPTQTFLRPGTELKRQMP